MAKLKKITSIDELYTFTRSGEVQSSQSRMDTSVSTTTSQSGGFNSQLRTSTNVSSTEMLRIFVRQDNGTEFEVEFADPGFGVREGHRVTIVYGGDQASQAGHAMALVNHSTNREQVFDKRVEWLVSRMESWVGCFAILGIALVAAMLVIALIHAELFVPGFVIGLIGAGIWMFLRKQKNDALVAEIVAALNAKVKDAIEEEKARVSAS